MVTAEFETTIFLKTDGQQNESFEKKTLELEAHEAEHLQLLYLGRGGMNWARTNKSATPATSKPGKCMTYCCCLC